METQTQPQVKAGAKNFFINLGSIIALGVLVGHLTNLLFTVINKAYPATTGYYDYYGSYSISWPVATLIITFPIYILLMWLLEREYRVEPEKRFVGVRRWLTWVTLFLAGFTIAGDLITILYKFIDGQELTTGFILKALSVLVIAVAVFFYYISDIMGKLNGTSRKVWMGVFFLIILSSVVWGFSVIGSPRNQQLLKYDEQKVNDLSNLSYQIESYYLNNQTLPDALGNMMNGNYYVAPVDPQNQKPYEYKKVDNLHYELCAEFNKDSSDKNSMYNTPAIYDSRLDSQWTHPAGEYCFKRSINPENYSRSVPIKY